MFGIVAVAVTPVSWLPSPLNDPVKNDAVTVLRIASDPDVISFFQLGILLN